MVLRLRQHALAILVGVDGRAHRSQNGYLLCTQDPAEELMLARQLLGDASAWGDEGIEDFLLAGLIIEVAHDLKSGEYLASRDEVQDLRAHRFNTIQDHRDLVIDAKATFAATNRPMVAGGDRRLGSTGPPDLGLIRLYAKEGRDGISGHHIATQIEIDVLTDPHSTVPISTAPTVPTPTTEFRHDRAAVETTGVSGRSGRLKRNCWSTSVGRRSRPIIAGRVEGTTMGVL
jgi:hypothetical protein